MNSVRLPLWRRIVLLAGVVVVVTGANLLFYRYYTRLLTLTIAIGSIDERPPRQCQPLQADSRRLRRLLSGLR
jgi:hypothetical protein